MSDLSQFPITARWPAKRPDVSSSIRCRRRTASRSRSCWRRSGCPTRRITIDIGKNETRRRRNSCRSIPTARSRRSSIPTGPAASRSACSNPARSCSISPRRPASCCRPTRRGATRPAMAVLPDGGDRADVRPARLLPQIRRQGDRRTSGRWSAIARNCNACSACWRPPRRAPMDHGRRLHHRRYLDARLGAQSDRLLRRRELVGSTRSSMCRAGSRRPGAAGGAARPEHTGGGGVTS